MEISRTVKDVASAGAAVVEAHRVWQRFVPLEA